jgi:hypothetical protein
MLADVTKKPISPEGRGQDGPVFTPRDLRIAGEAAEAMTGNLAVVCNAKKQLEVRVHSSTETDPVLVLLKAAPDVPDRPKPSSIMFSAAPGSGAQELVAKFDALFWSEAAFKKFLFSYYHGMRLLTVDGMRRLQRAYESPHSVAFAHDPKSVPTTLKDDDAILGGLYVFKTAGMDLASGGTWVSVADPQFSAP